MGTWTQASELAKSWKARHSIRPDRVAILNAVWEKELGSLARYWILDGVQAGFLYVKPKSSSAIQELQLRAIEITKKLNKYFKSSWIKGIKIRKF
ncbi:MAG: DUF721 domain-containing protein [Elusimicrobia bacterium]|nr:DUF721 domain-containing protein [Elusimicrobiota bacterium]